MLRALVVGDIRIYRDGIVAYLRGLPPSTVAGAATIGKEKPKLRHLPETDVAVLDTALPASHDLAGALKHLVTPMKVAARTVPDAERAVIECVEAAIAGYLSRNASGASGTGKTMAAKVVAVELGKDLYRVELAGVVSKYIGETEKNLERIFDAAERAKGKLLFDEADALFGKRSKVPDAHAQYANMEVSYLLQRMKEYDGVVILSTNRRGNRAAPFRAAASGGVVGTAELDAVTRREYQELLRELSANDLGASVVVDS